MKRIIYVSDATVMGGAEVYLRLLIEHLPPENQVVVVARPTIVAQFRANERCVLHKLPDSKRVWFQFCWHHRQDIFHFNLTYHASCRWLAVLAKIAGVKRIVGTMHTLAIESPSAHWMPKAMATRLLLRSFLVMIAPSQYVADLLSEQRSFPTQRITVVYNGVVEVETEPIKRSELGVAQDAVLVVAMGRLHREKGFDYLLRAITRLPENVCLALAGDGEERITLQRLAQQLGIESRVRFLGYRQDRLAILKAADMFVLSSLQRTENFPLVVLEAMMIGLPIVATRVGGVSEQLIDGESGVLVEPASVDDLTEAMNRVINDQQLAMHLAKQAALRYHQRFTVRQMVTATMAVY